MTTQVYKQQDNLTLVLEQTKTMSLQQRPLPSAPLPDQVQLATQFVGICGSDVKYWQCGHIGRFKLRKPMVLGHETSAIVVGVGRNVKHLKLGDRCAVEVGVPCSKCSLCKAGKYNLCALMAFAATPPFDGTLTRRFNHPSDFCFKLPEHVSLEDGAMLEPLAVAVHACRRAPVNVGDNVLVTGAGAIGLLCMLVARAYGAKRVIVTDVQQQRLAVARALGADETFNAMQFASGAHLGAAIKTRLAQMEAGGDDTPPPELATPNHKSNSISNSNGKSKPDEDFVDTNAGVDVTLEASGAESSLVCAINAARAGSSIVCVGCQADEVRVPLGLASMAEVDIKGLFRYRNCYPIALALVASGKVNLKPLVTHRFKLEQSQEAFDKCASGDCIKILIDCVQD